MRIPPQPLTRRFAWRRHLLVLAGLALVAGCAPNGDFGEVRPTLVRDDIHDWLAFDAVAGRPTLPSSFELTDDERAMRDLSYPLIEPPYDRQQWYSLAGEYGVIGADRRTGFDRAAYTKHLLSDYFRSPSARYAKLNDDIRNDSTRLAQFFETAGRVTDMDQKRRKSLAYVASLPAGKVNNALRRIRDNALILGMVRTSLAQRAAAYRFALERLVIMTPSTQAVEVERSLNRLQAQIAHYRGYLPPTWEREPSLAAEPY